MKNTDRIIITGASDGIGRALALHYAARGARLLLVARRADRLQAVADQLRTLDGDAEVLAADVSLPGTAERIVTAATEAFGGFDTVIMNAGRGGPMFVDAFDVEEGERVTAVNYVAVMRMLGAVLPVMRTSGRGTIVAVSSLAGYRGMPGSGAYNASKAAVRVLMESIRTELRGSGINVVTIAPGFVRTAMTAQNEFAMPFLMEPEEAARRIARAIDARRSEYRFPLGTSLAIRLLQLLPNGVYDRLIRWGRRRGAAMERRSD